MTSLTEETTLNGVLVNSVHGEFLSRFGHTRPVQIENLAFIRTLLRNER